MNLKFGAIQMLFEHPIVALMQSNTVIPNHPSHIDSALEMTAPLVIVELILICTKCCGGSCILSPRRLLQSTQIKSGSQDTNIFRLY